MYAAWRLDACFRLYLGSLHCERIRLKRLVVCRIPNFVTSQLEIGLDAAMG